MEATTGLFARARGKKQPGLLSFYGWRDLSLRLFSSYLSYFFLLNVSLWKTVVARYLQSLCASLSAIRSSCKAYRGEFGDSKLELYCSRVIILKVNIV